MNRYQILKGEEPSVPAQADLSKAHLGTEEQYGVWQQAEQEYMDRVHEISQYEQRRDREMAEQMRQRTNEIYRRQGIYSQQ